MLRGLLKLFVAWIVKEKIVVCGVYCETFVTWVLKRKFISWIVKFRRLGCKKESVYNRL